MKMMITLMKMKKLEPRRLKIEKRNSSQTCSQRLVELIEQRRLESWVAKLFDSRRLELSERAMLLLLLLLQYETLAQNQQN